MDHELQGLAPLDVVRVVSLDQCQQHCLETRKYVCRSANYFHLRRECHVFGDDRSAPKAHLVEASRVDFFENQCLVESSFCPYQKSEENQAMVYVAKSLTETPSTLHCERECNREREFNCRSYSFWDQGARGSVCMLSGENRLTGQGVGISYREGSTYSGKNCKISVSDRGSHESTVYPPIPQSTKGTKETHPPKHTEKPPYKPLPPLPPYKPLPPPPPPLPPPMPHMPPPICSINQFTYEKVIGHDVRGGRRERIPTRVPIGVVQPCQAECQRLGERCQGFVVQYKSYQNCYVILKDPTDDAILVPSLDSVYFNKVCLRERPCQKVWSFERYIHHEFHGEPIRETSEVLERADCEDLCLRERPHCKSAVYNYHDRTCRLFSETKRSSPNRFLYSNEEVEYLENQCTSESPTCQYRDFPDRFLVQIDRLSRAFNLKDCQRQCDTERDFICRSVNFETVARDCALSSEDVSSVPQGITALQHRRNSLYSEKGSCEQVSVQCNPQDMLLTIHFDSPFHGRVYAKGNPSQCFVVGTGQTSLQFAISMGSRCGTTAETSDQFVNEVVVQQHPVIMTDHDKTIKVICSFETQERTYTMAGPGVGAPGVDVARTYMKAPLTAVVTNTAPPPNVAMRVLDRTGRDARAVGLGEELTLKIELRETSSAFAIFARNLYARSTNGESLFLIDSSGCPTDATIFPALELDPKDHKSLLSTFKAFRFPSSGMVNFEVQIRFCQEKCEQVRCGGKGASFGRRKRDVNADVPISLNSSNASLLDDEDVYFDHDNYDTVRAVVQDEAHSIVFPSELGQNEDFSQLNHEEIEDEETTTTEYHSTVHGYFETSSDIVYHTITNAGHETSEEILERKETTPIYGNTEKLLLYQTTEREEVEEVRKIQMDDNEYITNEHKEMMKEHLMSESNKGENMFDIARSTQSVVSSTTAEYHTSKRSVSAMPISSESPLNAFKSSDEIVADEEALLNTEKSTDYDKVTADTEMTETTSFTSNSMKTIENEHTENDHSSKSFNRKFAFIHNEDNGTSSYTTPISSNVHNGDRNNVKSIANVTNESHERIAHFPRPDIKGFGHSHSSDSVPENQGRFYPGNERWMSAGRKDPFSANRNPYSANANRMGENGAERKNEGPIPAYTIDRLQPLPLNPQRLVGSHNNDPPRHWGAPKPPVSDVIPGHSHNQPPLQSQPIEIHEVPKNWDNSPNIDSIQRPPPNAHYNILNPIDDNRQSRTATTSPNLQDRPKEIKHLNTNMWGSNPQQSSGVQIQRPLEILDHPSQRHDRHPGYQGNHPQSNQPRPIELSNNQDRHHNPHHPDPFTNHRYDYNRVHMQQPRPMELPNQSPNANPQWNNNQNKFNVPADISVNSNNKWVNNNPQQDARPPTRNQNRPEEIQPPRQPYPQPPMMQNPQRPEDKWRNNHGSSVNSNSAPGRNNFYASQPQYRPSEVIATTQKSVPEEVPLSLAILVGEDGKSQNSAQPKPKQQWRPPPQYNRGLQRHNIINTPRPENIDEDKVCTSKATVIATAVSVTLVYLGVVAGAIVGYRWHRKNKRRKAMTAAHPVHFPPNPTNANVTYSTPDVTFRNVYGNFPVSSASTT